MAISASLPRTVPKLEHVCQLTSKLWVCYQCFNYCHSLNHFLFCSWLSFNTSYFLLAVGTIQINPCFLLTLTTSRLGFSSPAVKRLLQAQPWNYQLWFLSHTFGTFLGYKFLDTHACQQGTALLQAANRQPQAFSLKGSIQCLTPGDATHPTSLRKHTPHPKTTHAPQHSFTSNRPGQQKCSKFHPRAAKIQTKEVASQRAGIPFLQPGFHQHHGATPLTSARAVRCSPTRHGTCRPCRRKSRPPPQP